MPTYRVHRLKSHLRDSFRSAPHVSGAANLKLRDYEPGETAEASTPYAAFFQWKESDAPLQPGDVLEAVEDGSLRIYKYVGFEEACWIVPEAKPESPAESTPQTNSAEVLVQN